MLSEFGNLCLALALGFVGVQVGASLIPRPRWQELGRWAALLQGAFVAIAFCTLATAFLLCDFSLEVVASHDHTQMPWYYRLGATWGNYEGSLLLFILVLSSVGSSFALTLPPPFCARSLVFQGFLTGAFLIFSWFIANPFEILPFSINEGASLNPLLQDRGLLFHPPLLYLGYAGFSAPFSLALAALWGRDPAEAWIPLVKPWVLFAWGMLTVGVTLGSWWAYYELGWGGWWFWDPVENASLMPWLAGTALIHALLTPALYRWSLLLSLLTFGMSLLGTFLTRSGLLTSVHAFGENPGRTQPVLWLVGGIMGSALFIWVWRVPRLPCHPRDGGDPDLKVFLQHSATEKKKQRVQVWVPAVAGMTNWVGMTKLLTINIILLILGLVIVLLGTLYPLWSSEILSIGTPYFEKTFIPLMLPLLILIPVGSMMRGKNEPLLPLLILPLTATLAGVTLVLYLLYPSSLLSFLGIGMGIWVFSGTLMAFLKKRLSLGPTLAHVGVAVSLLGVSVAGGYRQDAVQNMGFQETLTLGTVPLTLKGVEWGVTPTYHFERATLTTPRGTMTPEKRLYKPQNSLVSETAIRTNGFQDLYVSVGAYQGQNRWMIHAATIPLAPWIWIGGGLMALGALVSWGCYRKRSNLT